MEDGGQSDEGCWLWNKITESKGNQNKITKEKMKMVYDICKVLYLKCLIRFKDIL